MTALLITGSERSGTLFTATVLRAAGIDAGHERAANVHGYRQLKNGEVEVAWEAAYLGLKAYTVHQVRHPLAAIASSVKRGTFDPATKYYRWARYAANVYPEILTQRTPLERAALYWLRWNGGIKADERWQIETLTSRQLNSALLRLGLHVGTSKALAETPRVHESDAEPLTWDQLGAFEGAIRELAADYGYVDAEPEVIPEPEAEEIEAA
jgi:hypothetical protein